MIAEVHRWQDVSKEDRAAVVESIAFSIAGARAISPPAVVERLEAAVAMLEAAGETTWFAALKEKPCPEAKPVR